MTEHDTPHTPERYRPHPRPGIWVAPDKDALTGWWYAADGSEDQIRQRIGTGLIFDTVDFGGFTVKPDEDASVVAAVANGIRQHGYAFAAWATFHDADPNMLATFEEHYLGTYRSYEQLGQVLRDRADEFQPRLHAFRDEHGGVGLFTVEAPDNEGVYLFARPPGNGDQS